MDFIKKKGPFYKKIPFLELLETPNIRSPVGGSIGGCGARAISRKTPIYFIVFHIEPRMLAQDLMRFGIIYFIFLMGFGQVSFFTKGFSQTNSVLFPRLTTSSS